MINCGLEGDLRNPDRKESRGDGCAELSLREGHTRPRATLKNEHCDSLPYLMAFVKAETRELQSTYPFTSPGREGKERSMAVEKHTEASGGKQRDQFGCVRSGAI